MGGYGWGRVEDDDLRRAIDIALDRGVRLFDTADVYGLGHAETLLGQALQGRRDKAVIATKFGVRYRDGRSYYDTSVAWINEAIEASLRRLGVDSVDLYQMHYWDGVTPMAEVIAALEGLLQSGKIRAYGVTNHSPSVEVESAAQTRIATYSYQYSRVHRALEDEILERQRVDGPVFMSWGSLGQGVLSGKYRSLQQLDPSDRRQREAYPNFHGAKFEQIQAMLAEMRMIAEENGIRSLSQLALRWIIDFVPRSVALVGIKRPEQILDAAEVLTFELAPSVCARLDRLTAPFRATKQPT